MNSQLNKIGSELEIRARNQGKLEAEVSSLRQQISRLQFELKATKQEKEKLEEGVKQLGPKWTHILLQGGFHECRTTIDLKDKWRNLTVQRKSA